MTWESRATYSQFMLTGGRDGSAYAAVQPIEPDDSGEWELVGHAPAVVSEGHGMVWYWKRRRDDGWSRLDEVVKILRDLARDSEGILLVNPVRER